MRKFWMGPLREQEGETAAGGGAPDGMPPADTELDALKKKLEQQAGEIGKMKEAFASQPIQAQNPPLQPQQPGRPDPKEIEKQFWKDPLNTTAAIAQQVAREMVGGLAASSHDNQVATAKMIAMQDPANKKIYDRYAVDVEAKLATVAPQFRTNPTVWTNAITMVKGEKMEEIMKERGGAPAARINDGPSSPSSRPAPPSPTTKLTPEEQRMARNLKLTDEQYSRGKARYENQEKSWGDVVTFDSLEKRNADRNKKQQQRQSAGR